MYRLAFLSFLFCFPVLNAFAQQHVPSARWTAGITLGVLPVPGSGMGIEPSVEYYFTDRFSLLTDITLQTNKKNNDDSLAFDKKYFRVRPEFRYILSDPEKAVRFYAGLQGGFANRSFTTLKHGFYYTNKNSDTVWVFDRGRVNSPVITVSVQMGMLIVNKGPLSADIFMGAGARFISTSFSDLVNLHTERRSFGYEFFTVKKAYNQLGSIVRSHYTAGLRLIWRFSSPAVQKCK